MCLLLIVLIKSYLRISKHLIVPWSNCINTGLTTLLPHHLASGLISAFLRLTTTSLETYLTSMSETFEDDFEIIDDDDPEIIALTELGTTLIQAILEKEPIANVQDLIDAGAPLWYQDDEGTSALHAAAYVENEQLVKLLIEEGAIWNAGAADATQGMPLLTK